MKKLVSFILAIALLVALSLNVFAATPSDLFPGMTEIVVSEYYQAGVSNYCSYNLKAEDIVIHNYGNVIESDYFVEGKSEGNQLIAVKYENTEYGLIENAYFVNVDSISTKELVEMVATSITEDELTEIANVRALAMERSDIKRYSWGFYETDVMGNQYLQATLTTTVTPTRGTNSATINGKSCSVWDILSFSQLKKEKCLRLCDQYTRLSVNLENQTLLSYGPIGTTLEGDVSVNLTGGGIDSFSYSFISGGFTTKDLSDMANNYGRWHFVDIVGNVSSFTTEPGIRATNTTGNFIVELSHAIEIFSSFMLYKDHGTGVIQIYLADR